MALQAKDLMIGDWIQISGEGGNSMRGEYHQINWIGTGAYGLDNKKIRTHAQVEPIPLTPEILEKNGWLDTDEPMVIFSGVGKWERKYNVFKYVHELQHALKLCGIDKEIEL